MLSFTLHLQKVKSWFLILTYQMYIMLHFIDLVTSGTCVKDWTDMILLILCKLAQKTDSNVLKIPFYQQLFE